FGEGAGAQPEPPPEVAALPLEPLETPPLEPPTPAPAEVKPEPPPAAPLVLTPPPPAAGEPGLLEPPPLDDSIVVRHERPRVTWKTYIGAPAAVIGLAGVTYGILQYQHHRSIVDDANNNPNLTQREAKALDDDAQSAYNRSRIGIFVGTPLL